MHVDPNHTNVRPSKIHRVFTIHEPLFPKIRPPFLTNMQKKLAKNEILA